MNRIKSVYRHGLIWGCGILLLAGAAICMAAGGNPSAGAVLETAETAVAVRRKAQQLKDRWAAEKEALAAEIAALTQEEAQFRWRRAKTADYIVDLTTKTSDLAAAEGASLALRNELGPLLDEAALRLKTFVAGDLPLHPETRDARLQQLDRTLGDADADLPSKTRALLSALASEIAYGYLAEPDEAELDIDGCIVRVHRLSAGRLGLFAVGDGGRQAWRWDRAVNRWEPAHAHADQIHAALQMAEGTRLAALVALPLGRPDAHGEAPPK